MSPIDHQVFDIGDSERERSLAKIRELQQENARLRSQLSESRADKEVLAAFSRQQEQTILKLRAGLDSSRAAHAEAERKLGEVRARLAESGHDFDSTTDLAAEVISDLLGIRVQLAADHESLAEAERKLGECQYGYDEARAEIDRLKHELSEVNADEGRARNAHAEAVFALASTQRQLEAAAAWQPLAEMAQRSLDAEKLLHAETQRQLEEARRKLEVVAIELGDIQRPFIERVMRAETVLATPSQPSAAEEKGK